MIGSSESTASAVYCLKGTPLQYAPKCINPEVNLPYCYGSPLTPQAQINTARRHSVEHRAQFRDQYCAR